MSKKTIRVLIIDDEPLARSGMSDYVGRVDFLTEVGQARDGMEAVSLLGEFEVDLLLLDVQMPGLNGVELMESLRRPPSVIFTTAHPGFAVDGFELNALDYLLKPITFPRFLKAALKAKERLLLPEEPTTHPTQNAKKPPTTPPQADLFIKVDGRVQRLELSQILYAESMQNYCRIHTIKETYLPLLPLKELEQALPADDFFRIHRTCIVRLAAIEALDGNQVRIGEKWLPVSRPNRAPLAQRLIGGRLL